MVDPVKQVKREIPSIWFHVKAIFNNFQESAFGIHIKMTEKKKRNRDATVRGVYATLYYDRGQKVIRQN